MVFELTKKHIADGHLDESDFASALGRDVTVFFHSEFPHYDQLVHEHTLPQLFLQERARAMHAAFKSAGKNLVRDYTLKELDDLTQTLHSKILCDKSRLPRGLLPDPRHGFHHFERIKQKGFVVAHTASSDLFFKGIEKDTTYVLPGLLDEPINIEYYNFVSTAYLLLNRGIESRHYWAKHTGIKPEALQHYPDDHAHILSEELHERRHLQQISLEPFKYDECEDDEPGFFERFIQPTAIGYYLELDADMAVKASLSEAGIGHETLTAQKHSRYLHLLTGSSLYWFAPAQEALERKEDPKNFSAVYAAVMEIRIRLMLHRNGIDNKLYTSTDLQDEITGAGNLLREKYWAQRTHLLDKQYVQYMRERPENKIAFLTSLRQLHDDGVFGNPFTREIVSKIIDAANYFNPDLLLADYLPSRRSLEKHYGGPVYS